MSRRDVPDRAWHACKLVARAFSEAMSWPAPDMAVPLRAKHRGEGGAGIEKTRKQMRACMPTAQVAEANECTC